MAAPPLPDLKRILADLSVDPDAVNDAVAVQTLVDRIADRSHPDMALAALMRWNVPKAMSAARREALQERVREALAARRREDMHAAETRGRTPEPGGSWLTVDDVVRDYLTHLRAETLLERLRTWEGRRRLGYPQWDGYRWLISSLAVDPATSAAYLAAQPAHEPIADLLPSWCERRPDDDASPAVATRPPVDHTGAQSAPVPVAVQGSDVKSPQEMTTEPTRGIRTHSTPRRTAARGTSRTTVGTDAF